MKIFNKLKQILFDEVTEEIPVITKNDKQEEKVKKTPAEQKKKVLEDTDDEVIIEKIETPKREHKVEIEEDLFDMPKLKEEAKEEVKKSTFTFPVFGDDEITSKRRERKEERQKERSTRRERENQRDEEKQKRDSVGYTNAFDYSYGKYKGDYKSNREQAREVLTRTLEQKEEHKAFTPSPIISPVYGVLNENYKKEDIVTKKENDKPSEVLDLDSVRRKAYGTLEDEIEVSLSKAVEEEQVEDLEMAGYEENEDEGISIDDLLVDNSDPNDNEVLEAIDSLSENEDEDTPSDDLLDDIIPVLDEDKEEEKKIDDDTTSREENKSKKEKEEKNDESGDDEDLFDLIESIYEGKEEE